MRRYSNNPRLWKTSKRMAKLMAAPAAPRPAPSPSAQHRVNKLSQRLSAETVESLVTDYVEGISTADLQTKYVLGKGSVLRLLHEAGVEMRRRSLSPEQLAVAADLYKSGMGIREVAMELGVAKTTVQNALARAGVEMRPGGRRRKS